jgi:GTP-binding protein
VSKSATVLDDGISPAACEAGRKLFAQACDFVAGVADLDRLPPTRLPELAFAGRSNVGKSSLLNALVGRRQLARTSQTPGRTQQINLFDLGGRLTLVDLPGYGYAQAPKPTVEAWQRLVRTYLRGRASLRRTCILVDARHGLKDVDRDFMAMLAEAAVAFQLVLTKADQVGQAELADLVGSLGQELERQLGAHPDLVVTSAHKGTGIEALRAALATLAVAPEAAAGEARS